LCTCRSPSCHCRLLGQRLSFAINCGAVFLKFACVCVVKSVCFLFSAFSTFEIAVILNMRTSCSTASPSSSISPLGAQENNAHTVLSTSSTCGNLSCKRGPPAECGGHIGKSCTIGEHLRLDSPHRRKIVRWLPRRWRSAATLGKYIASTAVSKVIASHQWEFKRQCEWCDTIHSARASEEIGAIADSR